MSSKEPVEKFGKYWGYQVRVASKFEDVFEQQPYEYDLKLAISNEKGEIADFMDFSKHDSFKHALVFFGGLEGIEDIIE